MTGSAEDELLVVHYFVDESGTPNLFAKRRKSMVGRDGCSTYFMLGKLDVGNPDALTGDLNGLRASLVADPYFSRVPSMSPERGKTFFAFHAKDDLPEIRREVFKLLLQHDVRFSAVVRNKHRVVEEVLARNQAEADYRYHENDLYDDLVSRLFKSGFHEADHFRICFAERGNKKRHEALEDALDLARQHYEREIGIMPHHTIEILSGQPKRFAGLQAVDYFLWALQRAYEAKEPSDWRYWEAIQSKMRVVHDIDDTRDQPFGVFYTPKNPLAPDRRA